MYYHLHFCTFLFSDVADYRTLYLHVPWYAMSSSPTILSPLFLGISLHYGSRSAQWLFAVVRKPENPSRLCFADVLCMDSTFDLSFSLFISAFENDSRFESGLNAGHRDANSISAKLGCSASYYRLDWPSVLDIRLKVHQLMSLTSLWSHLSDV